MLHYILYCTNYEYNTPIKTHYYKYTLCILDRIPRKPHIQLLTHNVTVLDTTTMLVTVLLVCLYSRHNKGCFWAVFGVLMYSCTHVRDLFWRVSLALV